MRTQSPNLIRLLTKSQLAELTTEVKETVAPGFYNPKKPVFSAAQLWNVQRQVKERPQRRFL